MSNEKGGLIKKKKPAIMQPAVPVKKSDMDFGYSAPAEASVEASLETPVEVPTEAVQEVVAEADKVEKPKRKRTPKKEVKVIKPAVSRQKLGVGKANSIKSLKVPGIIHTELNLLGSFMDENKTYIILQNLIDSYVKNELTNRQQRQFTFMVDAFSKEKE